MVREQIAGSFYDVLCKIAGSETVAHAIYKRHKSVKSLQQATIYELQKIKGVGYRIATILKASIELARHYHLDLIERNTINSPEDSYDLFMPMIANKEREHLVVMCLNTRNHVLSIDTIYIGSLNSTAIRVGEIFTTAIKNNAAAIIVAHNHPSGDPAPSPDDIGITEDIIKAGKLLDIHVLDHLILGSDKFVSLNRRGMEFAKTSWQ